MSVAGWLQVDRGNPARDSWRPSPGVGGVEGCNPSPGPGAASPGRGQGAEGPIPRSPGCRNFPVRGGREAARGGGRWGEAGPLLIPYAEVAQVGLGNDLLGLGRGFE